MPISQTRGLAARAAQNFDYYAGVITELHGRSFQVGDEFLNYTIHKPVGRGRADHALERAADALDLAARARRSRPATRSCSSRPSGRRCRRRCSPRCSRTRICRPASSTSCTASARRPARRSSAHPGRQPDLLHRRAVDRQPRDRGGRADAQALVGRARRQVAGRRVRGRRSRPRGRRRARADLHDERPALHRRLAPARRSVRCTSGIVNDVAARARNIRVGDPFDPRTELGPLITDGAPRRACSSTSTRRAAEGARILAGGERPAAPRAW